MRLFGYGGKIVTEMEVVVMVSACEGGDEGDIDGGLRLVDVMGLHWKKR